MEKEILEFLAKQPKATFAQIAGGKPQQLQMAKRNVLTSLIRSGKVVRESGTSTDGRPANLYSLAR